MSLSARIRLSLEQNPLLTQSGMARQCGISRASVNAWVSGKTESIVEHWGALRTLGAASWATWSYEQVLAYFSQQTNIIFLPQPKHPEAFELKRQ